MRFDDPALPAARHLTGPTMPSALAAAVEAAGGRLRSARACQVQYRAGRSLVVRYASTVSWSGREPAEETLLAATTSDGPPAGTLEVRDGDLAVGVWRYPFDPALPGLPDAVTPRAVAGLLKGCGTAMGDPRRLELEAVTYRPTHRAVVRVRAPGAAEVYLKVVLPADVALLVARHDALSAAGLPVPEVLAADSGRGVVVFASIPGASLRDGLRTGAPALPEPGCLRDLLAHLAGVSLPGVPVLASAAACAAGHLLALAAMLPGEGERIERIRTALGGVQERPPTDGTIHGDLHDAQIMVEGSRITGLVDLDDAGPGDALDDRATLLGHLAVTARSPGRPRQRIDRYAARLRAAVAVTDVERQQLDLRTAAVIVGLATGPFRVQRPAWRHHARTRLALAERVFERAGEEDLMGTSSGTNGRARQRG